MRESTDPQRGQGRPLDAQAHQGKRPLDAPPTGETVVLFPEGTSSDGRQVLPFASTLLQAALEAGVPVTPLAVRYHVAPPADAATDVCWWGDMKIAPHLLRLSNSFSVKVKLGDVIG